MADDSSSEGLLVIRARRHGDGSLDARITHGTAGERPALDISTANDAEAVLTIVRDWLAAIGGASA